MARLPSGVGTGVGLGTGVVPVIEAGAEGTKVKVGEVPHPMEENHYIEWVELNTDGKSCRHFFSPGDKPEIEFEAKGDKATAREYCSVHGLWKSGS